LTDGCAKHVGAITQKQTDLDCTNLSGAMAPFFETGEDGHYGFLGSPAWQVLKKEIDWGEGTKFFAPNPGVLYPAVYDLAERVLAAAKASRSFDNTRQNGWRCSLSGETEWLTADLAQLSVPPGARRDTLWTRVADKKLAWAKKGEHLGGLPAIKRLWPTIFAEEVEDALAAGNSHEKKSVGRFVVSTHTMALAAQLEKWLDAAGDAAGLPDITKVAPVALPRRLAKNRHNPEALKVARRIPGLLEEAAGDESDTAYESARQRVQCIFGNASGEEVKLETYYALLMMDGDNMGAILAGEKAETSIAYKESFHPKVRKGFDERAAAQPLIKQYGDQKRPVSPNRHLAISGALNDFSQTVVRHVVEEEHLGRVIYAGGDDVLAMLPVADLLSTMQRLRHAYSGIDPDHVNGDFGGLTLNNGFAALKCGGQLQLMRMMGQHATASCGAVIAHHQAPLGAVMRELRAAEKRAKNEGGRNAFSITVIKRAGGALHLTENWGEPFALLKELIVFLSREATSRRAAYNCLEWLRDLPDPKQAPDMLESLLAYQLERQSGDRKSANDIARRLAALAVKQTKEGLVWLENFLGVAEFLARETRAGDQA
jgi:CRISPR-associated protein Cmr2